MSQKMNKKCVILGAGGFGKELFALLKDSGNYEILGFIDALPQKDNRLNILGDDQFLVDHKGSFELIFFALGKMALRLPVYQKLTGAGISFTTFIHSSAVISSDAQIEQGCIIYPHTTVHSRAMISENVMLNSNISIGHETRLGRNTVVAPGVSIGGRVEIGENVYIGMGANIIEDLKIASGTVIGAGAVVIRDIVESGTYIGVPAKKIN
ncbi:MAG: acetyltransferase [Candidatus Omnitrophica bacterium]|nr:acetyltransferase [Candidatus Omnitrophota bacterium]